MTADVEQPQTEFTFDQHRADLIAKNFASAACFAPNIPDVNEEDFQYTTTVVRPLTTREKQLIETKENQPKVIDPRFLINLSKAQVAEKLEKDRFCYMDGNTPMSTKEVAERLEKARVSFMEPKGPKRISTLEVAQKLEKDRFSFLDTKRADEIGGRGVVITDEPETKNILPYNSNDEDEDYHRLDEYNKAQPTTIPTISQPPKQPVPIPVPIPERKAIFNPKENTNSIDIEMNNIKMSLDIQEGFSLSFENVNGKMHIQYKKN